jgi:hypothetical protein
VVLPWLATARGRAQSKEEKVHVRMHNCPVPLQARILSVLESFGFDGPPRVAVEVCAVVTMEGLYCLHVKCFVIGTSSHLWLPDLHLVNNHY